MFRKMNILLSYGDNLKKIYFKFFITNIICNRIYYFIKKVKNIINLILNIIFDYYVLL